MFLNFLYNYEVFIKYVDKDLKIMCIMNRKWIVKTEAVMKINWNSKYNTIATYAFIVVASVILFYVAISQIDIITSKVSVVLKILQPIIIGCALAYLFNFLLKFFETKVLKDEYLKKVKIKSKED